MSERKFDVTYEASAGASAGTNLTMHDLRFYESAIDGCVSVVAYPPGDPGLSAQTRLDLGQVIDLYEYLEDFIERHVEPERKYGPDLLSKRAPMLVEGGRVQVKGW